MDKKSKKMGRPRVYDHADGGQGAPQINLRLDPPIYNHIKSRPEGPRAYVQGLVADDIQRSHTPAESTSPEDVPGQLLLNGQQKVKE